MKMLQNWQTAKITILVLLVNEIAQIPTMRNVCTILRKSEKRATIGVRKHTHKHPPHTHRSIVMFEKIG